MLTKQKVRYERTGDCMIKYRAMANQSNKLFWSKANSYWEIKGLTSKIFNSITLSPSLDWQ